MANEFVARKGLIVYGVNSGSTSDQVVVLNTTTNKLETRTNAGSSGTSGTDGSSGTSGTSGTSGSSGTSGTSGTDGSSGTSGNSTLLYGTSGNSISLPPTSYGIAITGTDLGNSTGAVCAATPGVTKYTTTGQIAFGLILYTDSGLTTPQTGFSYVANDNDGLIFILNPVTGLIGTFVQSC
jgi:hypothetical protein